MAHGVVLALLEVLYWLSSWVSKPEFGLPWILLNVMCTRDLCSKDFPFFYFLDLVFEKH